MSTAHSTTQLVPRSPESFEALYDEAAGDTSRVPWADERAQPALVNWLNAVAPARVPYGARVAVIGCGLGHDARELAQRGYEVTAFDCSPTAITWAQRLHPEILSIFHVADLFDLPLRWQRRFDLVVEINTVQALPIARRTECLTAISTLLAPHGELLVICRGSETSATEADGPPWPLTEVELLDAAAAASLAPEGPVSSFLDNELPPVRRMRALFRHTGRPETH